MPACRWVQLACARQKTDLARKRFAYTFDEERANDVVDFIEGVKHVKGRQFSGNNIHLSPWQCFIITTVFGWVDRDNFRRFRVVYIEVPRKNGKSTLTSPVGLYMLAGDGEPGAEVYSAATGRDQAKIVWGTARQMVLNAPLLRNTLHVETSAHSIFVAHTDSVFKPLSRDQQGNLDGLNVHAGLVDELHGHKDRGIWDVLDTATGSRVQPLLWGITTAGKNKQGICYEQNTYTRKILQGVHKDESFFGIIYTIDEKDDVFDPAVWEKANPNYGISVNPDDLKRKADKAKEMPQALSNFKTKHLNVWVNADSPWMNMLKWEACADLDLDIADFEEDDCYVACDLATRLDIAPKIRLFVREQEDGVHYYAFGTYFVPRKAIEEDKHGMYSGWEQEDLLEVAQGEVISFDWIEQSVREDADRFRVIVAAFDPWQANHIIQHLSEDGLNAAEYRQNTQNMNLPMKELEAAVLDGRFHHNGDPVLYWMVSNVVCHENAKEEIYPRKEIRENKIDGAVALIMAIGSHLAYANEEQDLDDFINSPVVFG